MRVSAISRMIAVIIVVVIIIVAGAGAYYFATPTTSTSSSITSTSSSHSVVSSSSSFTSSSSAVTSSSSSATQLTTVPTSATTSKSQPLTPVSVLYPSSALTLSVLQVDQDLGIFQKYGLSVTYTLAKGYTIPSSVQSGSATFGLYSALGVMTSDAQGGSLVIFGALGDTLPYALYVNPSITSVQQLIGKTAALGAGKLDPTSICFDDIVKAMGLLNSSQIGQTFIAHENLRLTALLSGKVDAAMLQPPDNLVALQDGYKQLGPSGPDAGFRELNGAAIVTSSYLVSNPTVVQNFMKALLEGYHDMFVNATGVIPALVTFTNSNESVVKAALPLDLAIMNPTWALDNSTIQATFQLAVQSTPTVASLNLSSVIDTQLISNLSPFINTLWGGTPPVYKYG